MTRRHAVHRTSVNRASHAVTLVADRSLRQVSDPWGAGIPRTTDQTTTGQLR